MNTRKPRVRRVLAGGAVVALVAFASLGVAQTASTLPPNLKALAASNFALISDGAGGLQLRFGTTSWNAGTGPLQLEAGAVDTGSGKQLVNQRLFLTDGTSALHAAGYFEYHPDHGHFHFDDYALYTLQPVNAPGGSERTGKKTTFCVMDTTKVNASLPGAPLAAFYSTCGRSIQGMSVGWGDTYGNHLAGQEIDFTNNGDGIYQLKIQVDPRNLLVESTKADNTSCVLLDIKKPNTVTVLDNSGACSTVLSITPSTAPVGSATQVTITGYGFAPGSTVTFDSGNGPRPVASNVVLAADTDSVDTITATITVPNRRNLGKDSVWNLRVGSGLLPNAFTVTR